MKKQTPDARLLAAAAFVRPGAAFADIGTDHAYLPLYLLEHGLVSRAYAADIGEGPLERARAHIREAGRDREIELRLTDGLCGFEDAALTDIAICGMGGELIVSIISRAPFVRDPAVRLILQPMTRPAVLRRYLAREGFRIVGETLCRASGRVYACMAVEYDGVTRSLTPLEADIGHPCVANAEQKALLRALLKRRIASLSTEIDGREAAGLDAGEERALRREMENLLGRTENDDGTATL